METFKLYTEKFVDYMVPTDKEKQLYDFYVLSTLKQLVDQMNRTDIAQTAVVNLDDDTVESVYDAYTKIVEYTAPSIADAAFFAVCSEAYHITAEASINIVQRQPEYFTIDKFKHLTLLFSELLWDDNLNTSIISKSREVISKMANKARKGQIRNAVISDELKRENDSRLERVYLVREFMNKYGLSSSRFMQFASDLFRCYTWTESYGGRNWSYIADEWLRLKQANNIDQRAFAIDRLYQAQHNTGSMLNKLNSYEGSVGGYKWIKTALDRKFHTQSPAELFDKASGSLRGLCSRVMHMYNRMTGAKLQTAPMTKPTDISAKLPLKKLEQQLMILGDEVGVMFGKEVWPVVTHKEAPSYNISFKLYGEGTFELSSDLFVYCFFKLTYDRNNDCYRLKRLSTGHETIIEDYEDLADILSSTLVTFFENRSGDVKI